MHWLFEPGFFASAPVHLALAVGAVVAIVAAAVGTFTVIRGQSFAGEALGDIGAAGGSSSYLIGIANLWGFLAISVAAAAVMELIGIQRARGRDLATGVVLGFGFGLAALFLYLDSTFHNTTGAAITILFGSIFALSNSDLPLVIIFGAIVLALLAALYRPLLLTSASPDLAAARGIPVRLVGALYLLATAVAVALAALTIGAVLSTALLVGPAASALRLSRSPGRAMVVAAVIGIAAVWLGVLLSYDSYNWSSHPWPASFFVVTLVLLAYLAAALGGGHLPGRRLTEAPTRPEREPVTL
jgi:zinc/manganese transport system permease protein